MRLMPGNARSWIELPASRKCLDGYSAALRCLARCHTCLALAEAAAEAGRQVFKAAANEDVLRIVNAWGAAEAKSDDFSA